MFLAAEPPTPPALLDPTAPWMFNWAIPIFSIVVFGLAVADSARRRRLTWGLLFLVNSMAVFWMETMADWGQELTYSPLFDKHHLLEWLPWNTPNDPVFMPFAYCFYWTVHAVVVLSLAQLLQKRFGWTLLKAIVVLSIPVNYTWDFLVEGSAAALGWWTYDPGLGPVLQFPSGGKMTLVWTIGVMCVWPNVIAYWAGKPPVRHLNHMERFFRLERFTRPKPPPPAGDEAGAVGSTTATIVRAAAPMTTREQYDAQLDYEVTIPRWRFELYRLGAWFCTFQVSYLLLIVGPLVSLRLITGDHSIYVP